MLLLTSGANPAQSYPVRHEYVWQSSPPHQSIATDNTVRSSTKALLDLRESGAIIETDAHVVMLIERDIHHVRGDLADDDLTADSPYQLPVPSLRRKSPEAAILSRFAAGILRCPRARPWFFLYRCRSELPQGVVVSVCGSRIRNNNFGAALQGRTRFLDSAYSIYSVL